MGGVGGFEPVTAGQGGRQLGSGAANLIEFEAALKTGQRRGAPGGSTS